MKQVSNKMIVGILLISMIIIVAGTMVNINRINKYNQVTGAVTSGNTTLVIDAATGVSVTDATASFGTGHVNVGSAYANIYANSSNTGNDNWTESVASEDGYMTIENTGNSDINLTVRSENQADSKTWLCGGDCGSGEGALTIASMDNEAGSCESGTGLQTNLSSNDAAILHPTGNATIGLCEQFNFEADTDTINVTFAAKVPFEATTGTKMVSLIFSANS